MAAPTCSILVAGSGASDGLTTWLRRRHPENRCLCIELEINQPLLGTKGWRVFQTEIAESLGGLVPRT